MDAKETLKYLYEHGHIISGENYKIIKNELAENARLKAELAKLREIIGLVNYYFEVRAKDPQCAGEVFRDLGQKMQALKGE